MKIIKRAIIRSFTLDGNKAKTYVFQLENGSIALERLALVDGKLIEAAEFAVREETFQAIVNFVNKSPKGTLTKYREEGR